MPLATLPPPVIVIGMHRSGTTLLADVIESLGVFLGSHKDEYNEDPGFRELNEHLFRLAGARWDWPDPVAHRLRDLEFSGKAETLFREEIDRVGRIFFATTGPFPERQRGMGAAVSWGWKDPRNSFTLPVWLRLFPDARVVHITRNGIDVAVSLWKRETSRPEGPLHPHYSAFCQTLEGCFSVWKAYTCRSLSILEDARHSLRLRFEDLLADTESEIGRLRAFLGLDPTTGNGRPLPPLYASRANAHRHHATPLVAGFAERVSCDPLLKELGYR